MFGPRTAGGILEVSGFASPLPATNTVLQAANLEVLTTANFAALIPMLGETQRLLKFDTAQVLITSTQQKLPKAVTTAEI